MSVVGAEEDCELCVHPIMYVCVCICGSTLW